MLIGIGVLIAVGAVALWLLAVAAAWIAPWAIGFVVVSAAVGVPVGMLAALVQMTRVLSTGCKRLASVNDLWSAPKGPARHFGWDRAWPAYLPHQARHDARTLTQAVLAVAALPLNVFRARRWLIPPAVACAPLGLGFAIGSLAALGSCLGVLLVFGGAAWCVRQSVAVMHRWTDRLRIAARRGTSYCPNCYHRIEQLSFSCTGSGCTIVHHDLTATPLGVFHRRCECGERLPTSMLAATWQLTPMCPICSASLPKGTGSRLTVPVPVFGAVGAGKTAVLSRLLIDTTTTVERVGGSCTSLSAEADSFATSARTGNEVVKTPLEQQPLGRPYLVSVGETSIEIQLYDAAGENFRDWHSGTELIYLDVAPVLVFVLDVGAIPQVESTLSDGTTLPSSGDDPQTAYAAVVDRLRASDVPLDRRALAVVLTKCGQVVDSPMGSQLDPSNSDSIRTWLQRQLFDGFVRRAESDFGTVRYFMTESSNVSASGQLGPMRILNWLTERQGAPRRMRIALTDSTREQALP
ncbi:hypothetical protein HJ590_14210 [Naumannella sp. ID2617S]|nr:hypothetical protein [Naumannella sp. ID2617S]